MEMIIAILTIGTLLVVLVAYLLNGMIANNQDKIAGAKVALTDRFGEGDYHTILPGPRCIGVAWTNESLILGDSVEEAVAIPLASVRSADIELDGVNVTNSKTTTTSNRGSQLAGGLVGGAILGPAGLIVGGLSGGSTSKAKAVETRIIKSVKVIVRVADRVKPIHTFVFYDSGFGGGYEADSPLVAPEITKANHFHALLTQVIEDRVATRAVRPSEARKSVSSEIVG